MKKHKELLCAFFYELILRENLIRNYTAGSFIFYLGVGITPHPMRFALSLLTIILFSCSTPKYTYYFDQASDVPSVSLPPAKDELFALKNETLIAGLDPVSAVPKHAYDNQVNVPQDLANGKSTASTTVESKKAARKELRSLVRELKKAKKESVKNNESTEMKKANPKNNGFAIAGFVLSIVGWFVLWPLVIVGIIFSAIGLNSEKRGLALAGLIIGIIGIILLLVSSQNGGVV